MRILKEDAGKFAPLVRYSQDYRLLADGDQFKAKEISA